MDKLIFVPPIAFGIVLLAIIIEFIYVSKFAAKGKENPPGKFKPYACGEEVGSHLVRPDYSQFFSFAYFFTIVHVVALILATFPFGSSKAIALAALYVIGSLVGLIVLFRR